MKEIKKEVKDKFLKIDSRIEIIKIRKTYIFDTWDNNPCACGEKNLYRIRWKFKFECKHLARTCIFCNCCNEYITRGLK